MEIIHLEVEQGFRSVQELQAYAQQWLQTVEQVQQQVTLLAEAWQGPAAEEFQSQAGQVLSRLRQTGQALETLAQVGRREMEEWVRVDAGALGAVFDGKIFRPLPDWKAGIYRSGVVPLGGAAAMAATAAGQGVVIDWQTATTLPSVDVIQRMSWSDLFQTEASVSAQLARWRQAYQQFQARQGEIQQQLSQVDAQRARLEAEIRAYEEELQHLARERDELWNRIAPTWPLRPGMDDGILDAPWRTRSDEIEDRMAALQQKIEERQRQLAALNDEAARLHEEAARNAREMERLEGRIQQAEQVMGAVQQRVEQGIPPDGPTQKDLITSSKYGLAGCTNYVAHKRDVTDFPNLQTGEPGHPGHAYMWDDQARQAGYEVGARPVKGSIMVFERGALGADADAGHVAYVEKVEATSDGWVVTTTEANTVRDAQGHVVRGQHAQPYSRTYYVKRLPDGSYEVYRASPDGKPHGPPVQAGKDIHFIYDRRKEGV